MSTADSTVIFPAEPPLPKTLTSLLFFGGSFDPPHRAHFALADCAARQFNCEHILFMPVHCSPHKMHQAHSPAPGIDRYNMLNLVLADHPNASVSDYEINQPPPSYTVNTLDNLRASLDPAVSIRLLMGSDQAFTFTRWYQAMRILTLATPAILLRPPHDDWDSICNAGIDTNIFTKEMIVAAPLDPASSTTIREHYRDVLTDGQSDPLHPSVRQYIREHHLYTL